MDLRGKGIVIIAAAVFLVSTLYFTTAKTIFGLSSMIPDEEQLGKMCIRQVSAAARIEKKADEDPGKNEVDGLELSAENETYENLEKDDNETDKDTIRKKKLTDDPLVIIYHTHSSESYMPYKESNYHREEVKGTVREVGDVMEEELEKKGINVIHDKTVHDRPSYNESYDKSLATRFTSSIDVIPDNAFSIPSWRIVTVPFVFARRIISLAVACETIIFWISSSTSIVSYKPARPE